MTEEALERKRAYHKAWCAAHREQYNARKREW